MVAGEASFIEKISSILIGRGLFTLQEIEAIKKDFSGASQSVFSDFLLDEGLIDQEDLLSVLSEYYGVPSFDVIGHFFDNFLLNKFPKDFLLRNEIIPLEVDENTLIVIASTPRVGLASKMREFVSYNISFFVGLTRDICDAVKEFYNEAVTETDDDDDLQRARIQDADMFNDNEDIDTIPGEDEWD